MKNQKRQLVVLNRSKVSSDMSCSEPEGSDDEAKGNSVMNHLALTHQQKKKCSKFIEIGRLNQSTVGSQRGGNPHC